MKLSVIIVSYNEALYLEQAINSCLQQEYDFEWELIVGDDGSQDGSIDILKRYQELYSDRFQYFVMDRSDVVIEKLIPSIRVSNVLKEAFKRAKGDYLLVMSGDDYLIDNQRFLNQARFLDKNKDYFSCYTNFKKVWDDNKELVCGTGMPISRMALWSMYYIHISCFMFRKEALNYILPRFCDDTGLVYSLFCAGKSKYMNTISFVYRQHGSSIMHKADDLELNILELCLYQDVISCRRFHGSSKARYSRPLLYVFKHREQLKNEKYNKYLLNCSGYKNDILTAMANYNTLNKYERCKVKCCVYSAKILEKILDVLGRIEKCIIVKDA